MTTKSKNILISAFLAGIILLPGLVIPVQDANAQASPPPQFSKYIQVDGGGGPATIGLKNDGTVWAWGYGNFGQLGNGNSDSGSFDPLTQRHYTPTQVLLANNGGPLTNIKQIASSWNGTLALSNDNQLYFWGNNWVNIDSPYAVAIVDDSNEQTEPLFDGNSTIVSIAQGTMQSMALKSNGDVFIWGVNSYGALGTSSVTYSYQYPTKISSLSNIKEIAAGNYHSMALTENGAVYAWGYNEFGQVGNGTFDNQYSPAQISILDENSNPVTIEHISASTYTSGAVSQSGNVWAWGYNGYNQLGDYSRCYYDTTINDTVCSNSNLPIRMKQSTIGSIPLSGINQIAVSAYNILMMDSQGNGYATGYPSGNGTQNLTQAPYNFDSHISGLGKGGYYSGLYINQNGNIASFGNNDYGNLGVLSSDWGLSPVETVTASKLSAASGNKNGNEEVHLYGINLTNANVYFLGSGETPNTNNQAAITSSSSSELVVSTPSRSTSGLVNVVLTDSNANIQDTIYNAYNYFGVPSSPTLTSATGTNQKINLVWSQSSDTGGGDISGYEAHYVASSESSCDITVAIDTNAGQPCYQSQQITGINSTINNLTNDTEYKIAIFAINSHGYSAASSVLTATPSPTVPSAPSSVSANAGYAEVTLSWSEPDNGGSALTSYEIHYAENSATCDLSSTASPSCYSLQTIAADPQTGLIATHVKIQNLTNGTNYKFAIFSNNDVGLSSSSSEVTATPTLPSSPAFRGYKAVSASLMSSLAVDNAGKVWSWGNNVYGQLGDGSYNNHSTPTLVSGLENVVAVSAGTIHSLALDKDGHVWAWGSNNMGMLGDGTTVDHLTPNLISSLNSVVAISAGGSHSLALKSDGTVWSWGNNSNGQLGLGQADFTWDHKVPAQISGLSNITAIYAGQDYSLAVKNDGTVWAWGYNGYGQLGLGNQTAYSSPTQITELSDVVAVSGSFYHSLALKADGTVWAWGTNYYGQYGNRLTSYSPIQITELSNISSIAGAAYYTLAVDNSGILHAIGAYNYYNEDFSTLVDIKSASGSIHILALRENGTITSLGYNYFGQLGNNSTSDSGTPTTFGFDAPISTTSGPSYGGTSVTINGFNLNGETKLYIDSYSSVNPTANLVSDLSIDSLASTLTFTTPAHSAGAVDFILVDQYGQSSTLNNAFTYIGPPAAPSNVTSSSSNHRVDLSWAEPDNGGSALIHYEIHYAPSSSGCDVTIVSETPCYTNEWNQPSIVTLPIVNLTNDTEYQFAVFALNDIGLSPASSVVYATPTATVPSAPSSVSATAGQSEVSLSWAAPDNGGGELTGYEIHYVENSASCELSSTNTPNCYSTYLVEPNTETNQLSTSATISNLTIGTSYKFAIFAQNYKGLSLSSSEVTASPVGPAPTIISVTPNYASNDSNLDITVTGTNFMPETTVLLTKQIIGNNSEISTSSHQCSITQIQENSSTTLNCNLQVQHAFSGQWNLIVTNPDNQSATLSNAFQVNKGTVSVQLISPSSSLISGGQEVHISGYNFPAPETRLQYRVTNSESSALNNVQAFVSLNTSGLIDNGSMRSDCADIRVYAADQTTPLNYYFFGCNSAETSLLVKFDSLSTGDTDFYVNYGNPNLTTSTNNASGTISGTISNLQFAPGLGSGNDCTDHTNYQDTSGNNIASYNSVCDSIPNGNFDREGMGSVSTGETEHFITAPGNSALNISDEISLETWFKQTSYDKKVTTLMSRMYCPNDVSANSYGYSLNLTSDDNTNQMPTNRLVLLLGDGSSQYYVISDADHLVTADNTWHHVVATYKNITDSEGQPSGVGKIYLDGVDVTDSTLSTGNVANAIINFDNMEITPDLYLGHASCWGQGFNGYIASPRIFDRALNSTEVNELYSSYPATDSTIIANSVIILKPIEMYNTNLSLVATDTFGYDLKFGDASATNLQYVNEQYITATTPAHTSGAVSVSLLAPDGQTYPVSNDFTYESVPQKPKVGIAQINGTVYVDWGLTDEDSSITGYTLIYGTSDQCDINNALNNCTTVGFTSNDPRITTLTGLDNQATYNFYFYSTNSTGNSERYELQSSLASLNFVNTNVNTDSTNGQHGAINVTWSTPDNGSNIDIDHYVIRYGRVVDCEPSYGLMSNSNCAEITVSKTDFAFSQKSLMLTGLNMDETYRLSVYAVVGSSIGNSSGTVDRAASGDGPQISLSRDYFTTKSTDPDNYIDISVSVGGQPLDLYEMYTSGNLQSITLNQNDSSLSANLNISNSPNSGEIRLTLPDETELTPGSNYYFTLNLADGGDPLALKDLDLYLNAYDRNADLTADAVGNAVDQGGVNNGEAEYENDLANGQSQSIKFSKPIPELQQARIEKYISASDKASLTYGWDAKGKVLTITRSGADNQKIGFANNVYIPKITDIFDHVTRNVQVIKNSPRSDQLEIGSSVSLGLNENQVMKREVVVNQLQGTTVSVPSTVSSPAINLKPVLIDGVANLPAMKIDRQNEDSSVLSVEIPDDVNVTAEEGSNWDGTMDMAPSFDTSSVQSAVANAVNGASNIQAYRFGKTNTTIYFDKAVQIKFPGNTDRSVGYVDKNGNFHEITNICENNTQATNTANLVTNHSECKIFTTTNGVGELSAWTTHFTDYVVFDSTPVVSISSFSPTYGIVSGGTEVVISGANFTASTTVSFGSTPATSVSFGNSGVITAIAPAHAAGPVLISVTDSVYGSATSNSYFTYTEDGNPPPVATGNSAQGNINVSCNTTGSLQANMVTPDSSGSVNFESRYTNFRDDTTNAPLISSPEQFIKLVISDDRGYDPGNGNCGTGGDYVLQSSGIYLNGVETTEPTRHLNLGVDEAATYDNFAWTSGTHSPSGSTEYQSIFSAPSTTTPNTNIDNLGTGGWKITSLSESFSGELTITLSGKNIVVIRPEGPIEKGDYSGSITITAP